MRRAKNSPYQSHSKAQEDFQEYYQTIENQISCDLTENQESFQRESERLKEIYQTISAQKVDRIFKEKITEFYEGFLQQMQALTIENQELKKMLKALYSVHIKKCKTMQKYEQQTTEHFMAVTTYKEELIRVRELMGNQIRKLEKELDASIDKISRMKVKHEQKLENAYKKWNENQQRGIQVLKGQFEDRLFDQREELEAKFMKQRTEMEQDFSKEKYLLEQEIQLGVNNLKSFALKHNKLEEMHEDVVQKLSIQKALIQRLTAEMEQMERDKIKAMQEFEVEQRIAEEELHKRLRIELSEKIEEKFKRVIDSKEKKLEGLMKENEEMKRSFQQQMCALEESYKGIVGAQTSNLEKQMQDREHLKQLRKHLETKDDTIDRLRKEKVRIRDQLIGVRDKLIEQDEFIRKQDAEILRQKRRFEQRILQLEKDVMDFAKIKNDIINLKKVNGLASQSVDFVGASQLLASTLDIPRPHFAMETITDNGTSGTTVSVEGVEKLKILGSEEDEDSDSYPQKRPGDPKDDSSEQNNLYWRPSQPQTSMNLAKNRNVEHITVKERNQSKSYKLMKPKGLGASTTHKPLQPSHPASAKSSRRRKSSKSSSERRSSRRQNLLHSHPEINDYEYNDENVSNNNESVLPYDQVDQTFSQNQISDPYNSSADQAQKQAFYKKDTTTDADAGISDASRFTNYQEKDINGDSSSRATQRTPKPTGTSSRCECSQLGLHSHDEEEEEQTESERPHNVDYQSRIGVVEGYGATSNPYGSPMWTENGNNMNNLAPSSERSQTREAFQNYQNLAGEAESGNQRGHGRLRGPPLMEIKNLRNGISKMRVRVPMGLPSANRNHAPESGSAHASSFSNNAALNEIDYLRGEILDKNEYIRQLEEQIFANGHDGEDSSQLLHMYEQSEVMDARGHQRPFANKNNKNHNHLRDSSSGTQLPNRNNNYSHNHPSSGTSALEVHPAPHPDSVDLKNRFDVFSVDSVPTNQLASPEFSKNLNHQSPSFQTSKNDFSDELAAASKANGNNNHFDETREGTKASLNPRALDTLDPHCAKRKRVGMHGGAFACKNGSKLHSFGFESYNVDGNIDIILGESNYSKLNKMEDDKESQDLGESCCGNIQIRECSL